MSDGERVGGGDKELRFFFFARYDFCEADHISFVSQVDSELHPDLYFLDGHLIPRVMSTCEKRPLRQEKYFFY